MNYLVNLEGFEGQRIEVQPGGFWGSAKLLVNGVEARKGSKRGQMILRRSDGREVIATWGSSFLDVPKLVVENRAIHVVKPLAWYEWIWNGWPIVLIFVGGALGGGLGALAVSINLSVFRSEQNTFVKYFLTGAISVGAIIVYLILSIGLRLFLNR